jgi:hypothetical protein
MFKVAEKGAYGTSRRPFGATVRPFYATWFQQIDKIARERSIARTLHRDADCHPLG